jgi:hypothetical protein
VKFSFIAKHWPAGRLCEALGVSRGGFYAWLTRPRSQRRSGEKLGERCAPASLRATRPTAPGVWNEMLAEGLSCCLHGIERLMRLQALKTRPPRRRLLPTKMLESIRHRGPDNSSQWIDMPILLGSNRLSIIDLSADANQPMEFDDLMIGYNGEVYNYLEIKDELIRKGYRFRTSSDTEVVLAAYKEWGSSGKEVTLFLRGPLRHLVESRFDFDRLRI